MQNTQDLSERIAEAAHIRVIPQECSYHDGSVREIFELDFIDRVKVRIAGWEYDELLDAPDGSIWLPDVEGYSFRATLVHSHPSGQEIEAEFQVDDVY
jgi:hypothetical protein